MLDTRPLPSRRGVLHEQVGTPLYVQLLADFEALIDAGAWPAKAMIPTEQELCEMYGVSRTTVRQALQELTSRGRLYRKAGRGSFVIGYQPALRYHKYACYTDEMRARRLTPGSRFLKLERVPADALLAAGLDVQEGTRVWRLTRVRLADGEPVVYCTTHLPLHLVPKIDLAAARAPDFSLHAYLRAEHNAAPVHSHAQLYPDVVAEPAASSLGIAQGTPIFRMHTRNITGKLAPVEFAIDLIRADRFALELTSTTPDSDAGTLLLQRSSIRGVGDSREPCDE